jgi:hypothetical protein
MLNEFSYQGKTYCIKTPMDSGFFADDTIKFSRLQQVHSFFKAATNDSGAWTVIMSIAKWNYPFSCRPPKRCPEPKDDEFFDTFCRQILAGELNLVEIKADKSPIVSIKDLRLKGCCVEQIKLINDAITSGRLLSIVMVSVPFFQAFFTPAEAKQWQSLALTVYSIKDTDWESFGQAALQVTYMTRKQAFQIAKTHAWLHEDRNDYQLKMFWRGVMNAFE